MNAEGTSTLAKMTRGQAIGLLATGDVGRLIYTRRALPAVIPVNYTLAEDALWIWTASGSTLAQAVRGAVVGFEVDELDRDTRTGWSVVVLGVAHLIAEPHELARVGAFAPQPWVAGRKEHLIQIRLEQVSGRRIAPETDERNERTQSHG